jgi:signal transduction histidine kinase
LKLPRNLLLTVIACAVSGAVTVGVAGALIPARGLGPAYEVIPLTLILALGWAFPLRVLRAEETEAFQLDEAFFVAMALLLPVPGTVAVFLAATVLGNCIRRRPLVRAAFNIGQTVTAVGLGLATMQAIAPVEGGILAPHNLAAAVAGAAVFMLVNSAAVSMVISLSEHRRAMEVFREGLDLRVLVWAGGTALGLLAALGATAYSWALLVAAIPMATLNLVLREHANARRQSQRAEALFAAAGQIHASVAIAEVEETVVKAARTLLRCRDARLDTAPPVDGEMGAVLPDAEPDQWLIVGEPLGFEEFGDRERDALGVVAGIAARAIQNARYVSREQEMRESLEELNRVKSDFVSSVSHELRTPLTSILGYVEILYDGFGGPLSDEQSRMMAIVGRNAERLLGLIEELLLMGSLESGTLQLALAPVSVKALLDDAYQAVVPDLATRNLDVVLDVASDADIITGDPRRLDRALINLLTNAIKFTPDGGRVTVSTRRAGDRVRIEVADTGIGIPLEDQAKIFDRFFRSSSAAHLAVPGTGLGLAITKMIVDGHGGKIEVSSSPGKGTRFILTLPLNGTSRPVDPEPAPILPARR